MFPLTPYSRAVMQHLLQTGLSLSYHFVAAAFWVKAAGDKDFPEHSLHSGAKLKSAFQN